MFIKKIFIILLFLCSPGFTQPSLSIKWTYLAEIDTSFFMASSPVLIDGTNTYLGPNQTIITQAIACEFCLLIEFQDDPGYTNEMLFSEDLTNWYTTNLRFVMKTNISKYYIPPPFAEKMFFRTRRL